ncbi:hypothetical protein [Wolbachia endosymbiont (group A) of Bibio marci]|uniref:hypothetical protein n=1 Tax=Wolbachia endosymbiont (group A) of Bibio marci TaxID=2953987 RepID=UPI00223276E9|nr:hypothetical protein [Wolbachia endosymbiont (group A) of Bibio marci]
MSWCHPSALTHSCTNVFGLTHQWVSFQCLTLEWLCCIASYDGLKIKKIENISSLLFWYL